MRITPIKLCTAAIALSLVVVPRLSVSQEQQDKIDQLLAFCLASGEQQVLTGELSADGEVKLIGSNLSADGNLLFSRQEWSGLIGGISSGMTELQAEQANKVRECLEPARQTIFDQILSE